MTAKTEMTFEHGNSLDGPSVELTYEWHSSLNRYRFAFVQCQHSIVLLELIRNPTVSGGRKVPSRLPRHLATLTHWAGALLRVAVACTKGYVVVREFHNKTFPLFAALLFPLRRRIFLVINENVQEAYLDRQGRDGLKRLFRMGFRFLCPEGIDGLSELGIRPSPGQILEVPNVLLENRYVHERPVTKRPLVGIVGWIRGEKGTDSLIRRLHQARDERSLDVEILLGAPQHNGIEKYVDLVDLFVDTSDDEGFKEALLRSDVIVLNYQAESYQYRGSGVVANAAELGTSIVTRNLPILRNSISIPCWVGESFDQDDQIVQAIHKAIALRKNSPENALEFLEYRSPARVATLIDSFLKRYP